MVAAEAAKAVVKEAARAARAPRLQKAAITLSEVRFSAGA